MLQLRHVEKSYRVGDTKLPVIQDFNLTIQTGEKVAIMGPSGSGKSTLLNLMSTMDTCDSGTILFDDLDVTKCSARQKSDLRLHKFGFVFQSFYLVDTLNVFDNIVLPVVAAKKKLDQAAFDGLIKKLGLADRLYHFPHQLSGGEQQRAAIARALIHAPQIVFADEPTGNLDAANSEAVISLLTACCTQNNQTLVLVTHDASVASYANTIVELDKGRTCHEKT